MDFLRFCHASIYLIPANCLYYSGFIPLPWIKRKKQSMENTLNCQNEIITMDNWTRKIQTFINASTCICPGMPPRSTVTLFLICLDISISRVHLTDNRYVHQRGKTRYDYFPKWGCCSSQKAFFRIFLNYWNAWKQTITIGCPQIAGCLSRTAPRAGLHRISNVKDLTKSNQSKDDISTNPF